MKLLIAPLTCALFSGVSVLAGEPAAAAGARITFSEHIAPIFQSKCQECHRPGETAPMSLLTYKEARPWARSIRRAVKKGEMPPWHADPTYGTWRNEMSLSPKEKEQIIRWVDSGAPEGNPQKLPPEKEFPSGWKIGKPDVVFEMPREFKVKAEGEVPYKYFVVPTNFKEDKWIQAGEARPGNPEVVHHIIVFIRPPAKAGPRTQTRRHQRLWDRHLCGMAPGSDPDKFPPGTAKLVPAGSNLVMQVHYTPNGKEQTDRSKIGLIFAKEPPEHRMRIRAVANVSFAIPPGAASHVVRSRYTLRREATLWALMPHMHLRGKSFRYELELPSGERRTLLNVPEYDFNWQHNYVFESPLRLPKGSRIHCEAVFDNSKNNPANPDPTIPVRWGDQTWDEMMIGFVSLTFEDESPRDGVQGAAAEAEPEGSGKAG